MLFFSTVREADQANDNNVSLLYYLKKNVLFISSKRNGLRPLILKFRLLKQNVIHTISTG